MRDLVDFSRRGGQLYRIDLERAGTTNGGSTTHIRGGETDHASFRDGSGPGGCSRPEAAGASYWVSSCCCRRGWDWASLPHAVTQQSREHRRRVRAHLRRARLDGGNPDSVMAVRASLFNRTTRRGRRDRRRLRVLVTFDSRASGARSAASILFSRAVVRHLRACALPSIEPNACIWPAICSLENARGEELG